MAPEMSGFFNWLPLLFRLFIAILTLALLMYEILLRDTFFSMRMFSGFISRWAILRSWRKTRADKTSLYWLLNGCSTKNTFTVWTREPSAFDNTDSIYFSKSSRFSDSIKEIASIDKLQNKNIACGHFIKLKELCNILMITSLYGFFLGSFIKKIIHECPWDGLKSLRRRCWVLDFD